jgi:hypothetical protein
VSTVKAVNFQVGQSLTASQNFSWYQPASPDGTVRLGVGNAGATTSDVLVANSSGNVGIGTSSPNLSGSSTSLTVNTGTAANYSSLELASGGALNFYINSNNAATYISSQGTRPMVFYTNGSERMRIDSSGNLGLGVTPSGWATNGTKALQFPGGAVAGYTNGTSNNQLLAYCNAYNNGTNSIYINSDYATYYRQYNGTHAWFNAPSGTAGNAISFTQAMTLDASGNLIVGVTSALASGGTTIASSASTPYVYVSGSATTNAASGFQLYSSGASAYRFYVGFGGTISATSTTITSISDQRLKENIVDIDVGLSSILALKPRKFDWKPGKGKDKKGDRGWIAQEFEQVFPEMIDQWIDPAPEGEEPYKAVNADLIPVIVKAIQELSAQVTTLQAEINALKA